MRKKVLFALLALFGIGLATSAQTRIVSGTVTDAKTKTPIPGVTVQVKGTTVTARTGDDGGYAIVFPGGGTMLVFSAVGRLTVEMAVPADNVLNVAMEEDAQSLNDFVVTANSIKREKRSLGYATTELKGADITQGKDRSVLNSMQGKVAGVQISSASGSPGSSTRIVLRGGSSLTGNNQALIVVDGIPIDNSSFQNTDQLNNQVDAGNRANDINPDDVETVNILKGPAAAALYGSRASNGAVIITTKSGKKGTAGRKNTVSIGTSMQWQDILKLPDFQNSYGQGGEFQPDSRENFSWGPKFDGTVRPWGQEIDGQRRVKPYVGLPTNVKDFFDKGFLASNNVSLTGGGEKSNYYISFNSINNTGIMPTTGYNRKSVRINASNEFSSKLTSSVSMNYAKIGGDLSLQGQGFSAYDQILQTPRDISIVEQKDLNNKFNSNSGYYGAYTLNPYYILANSKNRNDVDHVTGNAQLNYKPLSWLNIVGRAGTDFYTDTRTQSQPKFSVVGGQNDGQKNIGTYYEDIYKVNELTTDLMATATKEFKKHYKITALVGHNVRERKVHNTYASTAGLVIPDFFGLENSAGPIVASNSLSVRRLWGIYTDINLSYKNYLFLGLTARNDHSSTLPVNHNSFFYSSVNAGFVFTDAFKIKSKKFNYGKLRASFAQVGNDADPYLLNSVFVKGTIDDGHQNTNLNFPFNGVPGFEKGDRIGNPNLRPERTSSFEVGTEMSFFSNRLSLDFAYYHNKSRDQILSVPIAPSSGYTSQTINAGVITNQGIELLLKGAPIKTKNFTWTVTVTYTRNRNKVVSLYEGTDQVDVGGAGGSGISSATVVAQVGQAYGSFYAVDAMKDASGNIIVDSTTGMPLINSTPRIIGNYQPKYMLGLGNTFAYKGWSLYILFDQKKGGMFYCRTKDIMEFVGSSSNTVNAEGNRNDFVIPGSVYKSESSTGGYLPNTTKAHTQTYWTDQSNSAFNIIDASFIKLREVSLTYTLPKKWFTKTFIGGLNVGISGRNLWIKTAKENTFVDPELNSFGNSNVQGFEYGAIPSLRSYGFNVSMTF
jgi:TonB-linked SusC/RagA family outer membrane protein